MITKERRKKLLWRVPLVVAILFAIFWGIWYFVAGEVPIATQAKWDKDTAIQLPLAMSRFWDIVFAFICTVILIHVFAKSIQKQSKDITRLSFIILIFGPFTGTVFGLPNGLGVGLITGLAFSLLIGLVTGLGLGLGIGLEFSLIFGLGAGLGIGLGIGLGNGLAIGLGVSLSGGLGVGLGALIKFIASQKTWSVTGHWLSSTWNGFWAWVTAKDQIKD